VSNSIVKMLAMSDDMYQYVAQELGASKLSEKLLTDTYRTLILTQNGLKILPQMYEVLFLKDQGEEKLNFIKYTMLRARIGVLCFHLYDDDLPYLDLATDIVEKCIAVIVYGQPHEVEQFFQHMRKKTFLHLYRKWLD
jgi:hypothetical protein